MSDIGTGVRGEALFSSLASADAGVHGASAAGIGVFGETSHSGGTSDGIAGVVGTSNAIAGVGVRGSATNVGGSIGVWGSAGPAGYAGYFSGKVYVQGDFTVVGGIKSAAVPHPDGSHRRLYCVESPENWFEDFGSGTLVAGVARIALDADCAALVRTEEYHVFLTPRGDSQGLYVSSQTPAGFEVREQRGGTSNISFSYRLVARRGDVPAPRLPRVAVPQLAAANSVPGASPRPAAPVPSRR